MRRIPELDGLRGFAAGLVVVFHMWPETVFFGWAAVDLFFVLSGYLITSIILENRSAPSFLPRFYARRVLRIFPAYYLLIVSLAILTRPPRGVLATYLLYAQGLAMYAMPGRATAHPLEPSWSAATHTWSLAVEEQFYLVWPGLLLLAGRRGVIPLALGAWATSLVARASGFSVAILGARCDGLALGAILAAIEHAANGDTTRDWWRAARWCVVAAAVAATAMFASLLTPAWSDYARPFDEHFRNPVREITTVSLLSFVAVALCVRYSGVAWLAPLRARPLRGLGMVSYGVYLYHWPLCRLLADRPVAYFAATLAVALASWYLVEQPILRLKDRFGYRSRADKQGHSA